MKKRITEIEESNEVATLALSRTRTGIRRLRLEYVILLERLEERAIAIPDGLNEMEEMSPPPSPTILDDSLNSTDTETTRNSLNKKGKRTRRFLGNAAPSAKIQRLRDPDLPKRPTNAYLIFCEMEKEKIRHDIETTNGLVSDLSKAMSDAWKNLETDKRGPYYKLYEEDRERYKREMEVYNKKKQAEEEEAKLEDKDSIKKQKTDTAEATATATPEATIDAEVNEDPKIVNEENKAGVDVEMADEIASSKESNELSDDIKTETATEQPKAIEPETSEINPIQEEETKETKSSEESKDEESEKTQEIKLEETSDVTGQSDKKSII